MAVTRKTQKDIGTYEAKLIGPFTARQTAILGIGAIPTLISYTILYGITGSPWIAMVSMILMAPFAFVAFGKSFCQGDNPEEFFIEWYYYHVKSPEIRTYEAYTLDDKLYDEHIKELKKERAAQEARKKKAKRKFDEELIEIPQVGFKKYPHKPDSEIKEFV